MGWIIRMLITLAAVCGGIAGSVFLAMRWIWRRNKPKVLMSTVERREANLREQKRALRLQVSEERHHRALDRRAQALEVKRRRIEAETLPAELQDDELAREHLQQIKERLAASKVKPSM